MDKALLNLLAIIFFIGIISYVIPVAKIDVSSSLQSMVTGQLAAMQITLPTPPTLRPIPTLFPIPSFPIPSFPWPTPKPTAKPPSSSPTQAPTAGPTPTPAVTPAPSPTPTLTPAPTAAPPVVIVTISPEPTSIEVNVTIGPVAGNVSATPTTGVNVTEKVGTGDGLAWAAIVVLALLLIAVAAWYIWKGKK